jgi:hypothetical protein
MEFYAELPNVPLHQCARCGTLVEGRTPMCIPCQNNLLLGLRLAVKSSALTDWEPQERDQAWLNHKQMMHNYALAQQWVDWGAFVRWPTWVALIMARAADQDPQFWEVEG